jgi:hypothetical protein
MNNIAFKVGALKWPEAFMKMLPASFKSIGIEYRQFFALNVSPIPQSILRTKTIADTMTDTGKVSPIPPISILLSRY